MVGSGEDKAVDEAKEGPVERVLSTWKESNVLYFEKLKNSIMRTIKNKD